jgi:hypothetical protein
MLCRGSILALGALSLGLLLGPPARAQGRRAAGRILKNPRIAPKGPRTPIQEFETLPPDEQQRALNRLPPAQRRRLQERLDRFNQLPEEQRRSLTNLYNRLHELPPERQNSVRKAINRLSEQPAERQQTIRRELRSIAALPADERKQRLDSPEFRSRFNKREQEILRDMAPLLPSQ